MGLPRARQAFPLSGKGWDKPQSGELSSGKGTGVGAAENGDERLRETLNALKSPVWLLIVSDKTPSVRTCGLKPSTLKQLGQPIQQPSNTSEVKVRPILQRWGFLGGLLL